MLQTRWKLPAWVAGTVIVVLGFFFGSLLLAAIFAGFGIEALAEGRLRVSSQRCVIGWRARALGAALLVLWLAFIAVDVYSRWKGESFASRSENWPFMLMWLPFLGIWGLGLAWSQPQRQSVE
jgi:hypothetical protein